MSELSQSVANSVVGKVLDAARSAAPKRTGRFSAGLTAGVTTTGEGSTVTVVSTVDKPEVVWLRMGTRPHIIEPRNGSALAFQWNGENVVFRRVHHPGTQPSKMFAIISASMKSTIVPLAKQAASEVIRGMLRAR